jgi:hypothetical protein
MCGGNVAFGVHLYDEDHQLRNLVLDEWRHAGRVRRARATQPCQQRLPHLPVQNPSASKKSTY